MGPEERERLFEQAREYTSHRQTADEAVALWGEVIDAYRAAVRADPSAIGDKQQLGGALSYRAALLSLLSHHTDAIAAAREAVTVFEQTSNRSIPRRRRRTLT